jgi:parvulin-like peptidyl-prolyl isomerase
MLMAKKIPRFVTKEMFRMQLKKNAVLILSFIAVFLVNLSFQVTPSLALIVDRILATVNDEIITYADYVRFSGKSVNMTEQDWIDEDLLRRLIEDRMILSEAKKKGIQTSEEEIDKEIEEFQREQGFSQEDLEKSLKEEGLTLQMYRNSMREKITLSKLVHDEVDSKVFVAEKEIEDYFISHKQEFLVTSEAREVKAIFIRVRERASVTELTDLKRRTLEIVSRLKRGEDFDRLVEEYSDEPLKSLGGVLGTFKRGTMVSALNEKAFAMKNGETSDPLWVAEGVYILKIINSTDETYKTLSEANNEVRGKLFKQKHEKLFKEWLKTLWEKTSVTINQG